MKRKLTPEEDTISPSDIACAERQSLDIISEHPSKKLKGNNNDVNKTNVSNNDVNKTNVWVSATETKNFMVNDGLVDIIKKRNYPSSNNSEFITYIKSMGHRFEDLVVNFIDKNFFPVKKITDFYLDKDKYIIECMKKGLPILYQVPLHNSDDNTYGIADLVVRSDILNDMFLTKPLTRKEKRKGCGISKNYHYIVLDIKYSTLYLRSDGIHILNSKNFPAYKSQLLIYNRALSKLQEYTTPYAFIVGRGWRYRCCGVDYMGHFLERIGKIDFDKLDNSYHTKTDDAISWNKEVKKGGELTDKIQNDIINLYPNMCRKTDSYDIKKIYSDHLHDITELWYCGVKNRVKAFENGIKGWDDKRCTAKIIGAPKSRRKIIDKIIKINRDSDKLLLPNKIKNNYLRWKKPRGREYFVDFESISDIFDDFKKFPYKRDIPNKSIIFLIGVGWVEDDVKVYDDNEVPYNEVPYNEVSMNMIIDKDEVISTWRYKSFICKSLTEKEEKRIITEFLEFISDAGLVIHWSPAEKNMLNKVSDKSYTIKKRIKNKNIPWFDLCQLFREEPIVIKGCFSFGLKDISTAMFKNKMITTNWVGISGAMDCSLSAWRKYTEKGSKSKGSKEKRNKKDKRSKVNLLTDRDINFDDITKYNEIDCKVMYEIIRYLRENHI